jgi:hypothetical protein
VYAPPGALTRIHSAGLSGRDISAVAVVVAVARGLGGTSRLPRPRRARPNVNGSGVATPSARLLQPKPPATIGPLVSGLRRQRDHGVDAHAGRAARRAPRRLAASDDGLADRHARHDGRDAVRTDRWARAWFPRSFSLLATHAREIPAIRRSLAENVKHRTMEPRSDPGAAVGVERDMACRLLLPLRGGVSVRSAGARGPLHSPRDQRCNRGFRPTLPRLNAPNLWEAADALALRFKSRPPQIAGGSGVGQAEVRQRYPENGAIAETRLTGADGNRLFFGASL